jgi:hypothetical protein
LPHQLAGFLGVVDHGAEQHRQAGDRRLHRVVDPGREAAADVGKMPRPVDFRQLPDRIGQDHVRRRGTRVFRGRGHDLREASRGQAVGSQRALQLRQACRRRLVGRQHDAHVGMRRPQAPEHRQPQLLVGRPGAAQHQQAAAEGAQGRGGGAALRGFPAQDHLLGARVAGHADGAVHAQFVDEAALVLPRAHADVREAVEEIAVKRARQRMQARAAGPERTGHQHDGHAGAVGGEHLVGPAVELDEHQQARPPGGDEPLHGPRPVERQVLVDVGAGAALREMPPRGREMRDHERRVAGQFAQGGDEWPGLLVFAHRRHVEPHAALGRGGRRLDPDVEAAAATQAFTQLGQQGRRQRRERRQCRTQRAVEAQGRARGAGSRALCAHGLLPSDRRARTAVAGSIATRQARSPRWQGRLPLREQGRHSIAVSSTRLAGRRGK